MRDWRARIYMNRGDPRLSSPLPTAPHFYDGTFLPVEICRADFIAMYSRSITIISSNATLRAFSVTSKRLECLRGEPWLPPAQCADRSVAADRFAVKS